MTVLQEPVVVDEALELELLVERFVDAAQQRSDPRAQPHRRRDQRHHRSWPLDVACPTSVGTVNLTVALHNASRNGIAFLSRRNIEIGTPVRLQLFWHDETAPRVPAVVRHATPTRTGYLIGCEFIFRPQPVNED